MQVQITFRRKIPGLKSQKIRPLTQKVLKDLACHNGELSILFTDDIHIAQLNRRYLGRKGPTNVLAFPMSGPPATGPPEPSLPDVESGMLGDVVISVDRAMHECRELGEDIEETVCRLLVHGILHLLNYDHERSSEEAEVMEKEQRRLLALMREES